MLDVSDGIQAFYIKPTGKPVEKKHLNQLGHLFCLSAIFVLLREGNSEDRSERKLEKQPKQTPFFNKHTQKFKQGGL